MSDKKRLDDYPPWIQKAAERMYEITCGCNACMALRCEIIRSGVMAAADKAEREDMEAARKDGRDG